MSEGLNRVFVMGNLGADPELRYTASGMCWLSVRLATTETFLDRNKEVQERTEWHNVVFWGARAEGLAKVLKKGDHVFVEGGLRTSSYEKDGVKRTKTEIHARELRFTGRRVVQPAAASEPPGELGPPPATIRMGTNGTRRPEPSGVAALEEMPY